MNYDSIPSLPRLFFDQASKLAQKPFLWRKDGDAFSAIRWARVAADVRAMARGLIALGVKPGDRVALIAENRPEWLICDLAIMSVGAITVPAFSTNTPEDNRHVLTHSGARGVIVSNHGIAKRVLPAAMLAPSNSLTRRGEYWQVTYDGRTSFVEDCRGLRYIALLIRDAQGERGPLHAKELVALATGQPTESIELEGTDAVLDATARTDFMRRLEDIAAERARTHDEVTLAALDDECDRIADALEQAGRGRRGQGRGSTFTTAGEKARKAVGKAISEAIVRIRSCSELSALADHLAQTVRKGLWLSYSGTLAWQIEFDI